MKIDLYFHTPVLTLLIILSCPFSEEERSEIKNKEGYKGLIGQKLNEINYSDKFKQDVFKKNVILNDYNSFLLKIIDYLKFKYADYTNDDCYKHINSSCR